MMEFKPGGSITSLLTDPLWRAPATDLTIQPRGAMSGATLPSYQPPIMFQQSIFFPFFILYSKVGLLSSNQGQGTPTLLSLKRPNPVPQPVAFTFKSCINVQEEVGPTRLITAISNSNTTKVTTCHPSVCLSAPLCLHNC